MTHLRIYDAQDETRPIRETSDPAEISQVLRMIGVRFEQWPTRGIPTDASEEALLAAYAPEIDRLRAEGGYTTVDSMRVLPDNPANPELRKKFLSEHRHVEDEVRFMVQGDGLFFLRPEDTLYAVEISAGDLMSVPAGMRHWFDMGARPDISVIRLFIDPAGWVAHYTGDAIADRFPRHEKMMA